MREENSVKAEVPKVSIIILPFDNLEYFIRSAESLHENTAYPNFEIVTVHNPCSSEEINAKIKEACDIFFNNWNNFKYRINAENYFHAKGCMEGVRMLSSDVKYVVLANDDIFIPGYQLEWLTRLVSFMEENPLVATVTPSLYHSGKNTVYWCGRHGDTGTHDFLHYPMNDPRIPKDPVETSYNNMAICVIRKYLLDEIPLGQTTLHYGSDSEFASRIKDKYPEMKHFVIPSVKLYHDNIYALRTNRGQKEVEG